VTASRWAGHLPEALRVATRAGGSRRAVGGGAAGLDAGPQRPRRAEHLIGDRLLRRFALLVALTEPGRCRRLEAHRPSVANRHTRKFQTLPVARALGAVDRDRHHGGAAVERQAADAGTRPLGDALVTRATSLRVDHHHAAAVQYLERRHHRLLVARATAHRKRPHVAQYRRQHAAEELGLGHVADAPAQVHRDEEVIERREVIGRDDRRARLRHKRGVDRPDAVDDHAEGREDQAREILYPIGAVGARPGVIAAEVLGAALIEVDLRLECGLSV
jgi:hypothetical protein